MTFSQRMGITEVRTALQVDEMDAALRNSLWNVFTLGLVKGLLPTNWRNMPVGHLCQRIWTDHLKLPVDKFPFQNQFVIDDLRSRIIQGPWYAACDLIEFIAQDRERHLIHEAKGFTEGINAALEREMSAYRFVGNVLGRITSEQEIGSIERALDDTDRFKPAAAHLRVALEFASDRRSPNYRNSIKESISAVEAACQIVTNEPNATLAVAVKKLEDAGITLHEAFKSALTKLYGYTSDAEGIRHALQAEPTLGQEDALFMLVVCSAFVNYLKAKLALKAGVGVSPSADAL